MLLNPVEKALMNNPIRAAIQRYGEGAALRRHGGRCDGARALEVGCGRGVGMRIIREEFGAAEIVAFDLDPDMVRLAGTGAYVADAEHIPEPDASFDAVFDFAILHHVPGWQRAIGEIARVLRPRGRFYFEEPTGKLTRMAAVRALLDHPEEGRFDPKEWFSAVENAGFAIQARRTLLADRWLLGVAARR
ncbi:MAG: class I SAM-dependent methyltransferase [Myxococcota bacterium]